MNLSTKNPPNWAKIERALHPEPGMVFTYGDTVYGVPEDDKGAPKPLHPHVEIHERVHTAQQGEDPNGWWDRYLTDPVFRFDQELAAMRKQYAFIKQFVSAKDAADILFQLTESLRNDYDLKHLAHGMVASKIRRAL